MPNKTTSSITTDNNNNNNNNNNKKNDTTSSAESIKNAIASFKQNPYYSPLYDCDVNYFRYKFSPDSLTIKSAVAIKSIDIKPLKKDESTTTTTTTKVAEPLKVVNNSTKLTQTKTTTTTTTPNNPIAKSKSMITKAQTETTNISPTSKDDNPKSSSSSSSNKSSTAAAALKKSKSIIALNKKDGNDSKFKKSVKFKNEDSVKVIKPVATLLEPANTAKSKPTVAAVAVAAAAVVATKPTTTPIVTNQQIIKTPSTTNTTTTTNTVKAQPVKPNTTTINNKTVSNKLIQTKQQETSKSLNNISKQVVFVSPNLDSSIKSSTTTASTHNTKPITTTNNNNNKTNSKSTDQIKSIANKVTTTTPTKPIEQPVIVKPNAVKPTVTTNTESIKAATATTTTTTTKINNVIDKPVIVSATNNIEANKTPIKNVTILAAQLKVEPIQPVTPIIATTNNKNKVTNNNKATKATSVIVSPQPQSSITLIKPKTLSLKNSSPISNPTTTTTTTCKKKLNNTFSKSFNHTNHLLINDYENLFDFNSSEVERSKSPDLNYRLSNLNQEMKLLQRNNTNTPNKESSAPPIITNQIVSINRKPSPVLKSVTFSNLNDHNNLDLTPIIKSPILPQPQLALPKSASFKIIEENKNINQQALIDQSIEAASVALLAASMSNNNNNNTQSSSVYLTTPPPITPSLILTPPPISPSLVTTPTPTSTPTNLTIDTIDTITTISNNNNNNNNEYLSDLEPSDSIYNVTKPESPSEQPILSPEINKQEEDEDEKTIISTSPLIGDQVKI
jgi:hypothetical protein